MGKDEKLFTRSTNKIYFKDEDQDFYLQWALSFAKYGGAEFGECLAICPRIKDGDPDSWAREWIALSDRIRKVADDYLANGHKISARDAYFRACTYNRVGAIGLLPTDPRWPENYSKQVSCFQKAIALLDNPAEPISIPFRDGKMNGYFMRPDNNGARRPTLIAINGGESISEDMYFFVGAAGLLRGYNSLSFDGPMETATRMQNPGWVAANFPRNEVANAYHAVVDYALGRPEVDPERLAAIGFSGGGIRVLGMAAEDPRVNACIADAPLPDPATLLKAEFPAALQKAPAIVGDMLAKVAGATSRSTRVAMERILYVTGDTTPSGLIRTIGQYGTDPKGIRCAFLALVGEGEAPEAIRQAKYTYDNVSTSKKSYRLFTRAEGADAHCQINNLSLMQQVVLDWLDDLFGYGD